MPAKKAPMILPGKASSVPIPIMFLRSDMPNAQETAYTGPSIIAESTFIRCCTGKHFANPSGMLKGEQTTPIAMKNAL